MEYNINLPFTYVTPSVFGNLLFEHSDKKKLLYHLNIANVDINLMCYKLNLLKKMILTSYDITYVT